MASIPFSFKISLKLLNILVTLRMVKNVVTDCDSSSGPNYILVAVLKKCKPKLSYALANLFNICLKESCFSDCRKVSSVVLVFKNVGEMCVTENYCPVSLLFVFSIVFEKVVNNWPENHFQKCGLFSDFFYLFRSSHSTADLFTGVSDGKLLIGLGILEL